MGADRQVPSLLGVALTATWIIGLINAYNFMDGVDGIAGATGVELLVTQYPGR